MLRPLTEKEVEHLQDWTKYEVQAMRRAIRAQRWERSWLMREYRIKCWDDSTLWVQLVYLNPAQDLAYVKYDDGQVLSQSAQAFLSEVDAIVILN